MQLFKIKSYKFIMFVFMNHNLNLHFKFDAKWLIINTIFLHIFHD